MRNFLVGLGALSFVFTGLVACTGGAGDLPTQRGVALSSGGTDGVGTGTGSSNGNGGNGGNGTAKDDTPPTPGPTTPECQLGAECEGDGTTCVVTSCDNNEPTCSCVGGSTLDGG